MVCPLCSEPVSPLASYVPLQGNATGALYHAHVSCVREAQGGEVKVGETIQ